MVFYVVQINLHVQKLLIDTYFDYDNNKCYKIIVCPTDNSFDSGW